MQYIQHISHTKHQKVNGHFHFINSEAIAKING